MPGNSTISENGHGKPAGGLLTPQELAALLQVKPSFVYRLAREDRIPHVRLGERYIRFERSAIDRWITERGDGAVSIVGLRLIGGDTNPHALSVALARLACDIYDVVQALAAEPLTEEDVLLLAAPAQHLALALDALGQILYELEQYGRSPFVSENDRVPA